MQLVKAILHQARRSEPDPAVAFGGGIASFGTLARQTASVVEALQRLSLRRNDLVILDIRNPVHHLATIYALALLGIRSASVSTAFHAQVAGPAPVLMLTDRTDLTPEVRCLVVDASWYAFDPSAPPPYSALLALPGFEHPDDIFRLVYSSGTTGRPKCVALTVRSMEARIAHLMLSLNRRSSTGAEINLMGFSTTLGIMAPFFTHTVGALLCFPASPTETLDMMRLFNVGSINGAVFQIDGLLRALGPNPPPAGLRSVGIAAAKVPPALLQQVRARLCSHVISAYGSTELGALSFGTADDLERGDGATGHLLPWVEMEAVDEAGQPLQRGQNGVLRARTAELAFYIDASGAASDMPDDGWFYPGDYGRIEPDGMVVIIGRTGEIINRGGVVIAPDYVEETLLQFPGVVDAAAFGVMQDNGFDDIWAAVVAGDAVDMAQLHRFMHHRLHERAPGRVYRVTDLPRAESGKVMRNTLRDQILQQVSAGSL